MTKADKRPCNICTATMAEKTSKLQLFKSIVHKHGAAGVKSAKEHARHVIEELRKKHAFNFDTIKSVDTTIGVILTNVRVKFLIPGSPGQRLWASGSSRRTSS